LEGVSDVETDMNAHTLTVGFDDETTSLNKIVEALGKMGYTVPQYDEIAM
jgi:copper chaperone CopZ